MPLVLTQWLRAAVDECPSIRIGDLFQIPRFFSSVLGNEAISPVIENHQPLHEPSKISRPISSGYEPVPRLPRAGTVGFGPEVGVKLHDS